MDPKAFYKMTYGLFVLTAREGAVDNGCIINTAVQVAKDPIRVSVAVIKQNLTCEMIARTGKFNLTSLATSVSFDTISHFGMKSGRDGDKFIDTSRTRRAENGLLYLTAESNMYMCCKVVGSMDLGSHMLFIGEVTEAEVLSDEPSCSYGYYQTDIKPKPQAAPSGKKAWVCQVCGYVYEGEEVPDDFLCPLCQHGKEDFVLMERSADGAAAPAEPGKRKFVCKICGWVYDEERTGILFEELPEDFQCMICGVDKNNFEQRK